MGDQVGQTLTEAEVSSTPAPAPSMHSEDLVSTVPDDIGMMDADTDPEGANNTGGKETDAATTTGTEGATDQDKDLERFDKHPRFVELNTRLKSAEERNRQLEERLDNISRTPSTAKDGKGSEELPYKDTAKMSDEELLDWQSEDPKGFWANMRAEQNYHTEQAIKAALTENNEASQQKEVETKVEATFEAYAKENPTFDKMWDTGEIQKYMDQNPGHNAISAHMALTMQERIEAAREEALKEADTKFRSTRAAARVIPASPGSVPTAPGKADDELKDPKKYGGTTAVLAARLARRRAQAGR